MIENIIFNLSLRWFISRFVTIIRSILFNKRNRESILSEQSNAAAAQELSLHYYFLKLIYF